MEERLDSQAVEANGKTLVLVVDAQFLAGLDRPALRSWLRDADREAANQLLRLVKAQVPLREQTRTALRTLPDPAHQALSEGRPIGLPVLRAAATPSRRAG